MTHQRQQETEKDEAKKKITTSDVAPRRASSSKKIVSKNVHAADGGGDQGKMCLLQQHHHHHQRQRRRQRRLPRAPASSRGMPADANDRIMQRLALSSPSSSPLTPAAPAAQKRLLPVVDSDTSTNSAVPRAPTHASSLATRELSSDASASSHRERIKVFVRVRPFSDREIENGDPRVVAMTPTVTTLSHPTSGDLECTFDGCIWSHDAADQHFKDQEAVFESIGKPLVEHALDGYNCCLLAYGQTGSGKTHSLMGNLGDQGTDEHAVGVLPRCINELFSRLNNNAEGSFKITISFCEIYNERITDLLSDGTEVARDHPIYKGEVNGLFEPAISTFEEAKYHLLAGLSRRATAETRMNQHSSRSHAIFVVKLTRMVLIGSERATRHSKMTVVDLAGSENAETAGKTKETRFINQSLLTLGNVIRALVGKQRPPFRDSKLTYLLQPCLGGNSKTVMLATISPAMSSIDATRSTLRYASTMKKIINSAHVNEDATTRTLRDMEQQIRQLRAELAQATHRNTANDDDVTTTAMNSRLYVCALQSKLEALGKEKEKSQAAWMRQFEEMRHDTEERLKKHEETERSLKMRIASLVKEHELESLAQQMRHTEALSIKDEEIMELRQQVACLRGEGLGEVSFDAAVHRVQSKENGDEAKTRGDQHCTHQPRKQCRCAGRNGKGIQPTRNASCANVEDDAEVMREWTPHIGSADSEEEALTRRLGLVTAHIDRLRRQQHRNDQEQLHNLTARFEPPLEGCMRWSLEREGSDLDDEEDEDEDEDEDEYSMLLMNSNSHNQRESSDVGKGRKGLLARGSVGVVAGACCNPSEVLVAIANDLSMVQELIDAKHALLARHQAVVSTLACVRQRLRHTRGATVSTEKSIERNSESDIQGIKLQERHRARQAEALLHNYEQQERVAELQLQIETEQLFRLEDLHAQFQHQQVRASRLCRERS